VATTALASIPGDPFRLGQTNGIDAMSTLVGNVAGTMLMVDNNSMGAGATALDLRVEPGKAPMKVNSGARVALLNADRVDGKDATAFYAAGSKVADSNLLDGKSATDFAAACKRTVVVSPTGTDTENGQALLNALNGITDASATKKYLIYIEPGTYDLSSGTLQMKQHVDIQGAGELNTIITSVASSECTTGTLAGATNAELRFLTVRNTSTGLCSTAIYNFNASPRLTHVKAEGIGATNANRGVIIRNFSNPTLTDVTAKASGPAENIGALILTASNPTISQSKLIGSTSSMDIASSTVKVALTQLEGPVGKAGENPTLQCFNNYDQNMAAVTCP
jgi:hypothetical protein